jgi:putative copper resistance protein D
MELLIDRQGYIRARWLPAADQRGWSDPGTLRGLLEALAREAPAAAAPDEHVH